jgi:AraC-like DNA-binding protein
MNNSHLRRIQDWPERAHEAGYSVNALARNCGVSVRTLERFFLLAFGDAPRCWLGGLRMEKAVELLRDGSTVKETSACLGYEDPSHFSREFKNHYGFAPSNHPSSSAEQAATPQVSHSAMKLSHLAMKS